MGFPSSGIKRRSSSMRSSIHEIQYLRPNLKKQKVNHRLSFASSQGKEINKASKVKGSVSDTGDEKKQRVNQMLGFSSSQGGKEKRASSEVMGCEDGEKKAGGDVGFSDNKAARAEMLKKRFGRIIVKAAEFQVEDRRSNHQKVDPVEMQRKNELMEKKLKEAKIAAEAESKMELQRKREAANKALEELERSVEVDDFVETMKDFAVMLGYHQNCGVYLCNEIGWYGAPVMVHYSKRRTS